MNPALLGLLTVIVGVGGCIGYFYFSNVILDKVIFPARDITAKMAIIRQVIAMFFLVVVPVALVSNWLDVFAPEKDSGFWVDWFIVMVTVCVTITFAQFLFPLETSTAGRNINRANQVRPWLFLFPALVALTLYLAYPVFETLRLSLTDRDQGGAFVGLANYSQMMAEPKFAEAIRNNMLWLIIVPAASTAFGLLAAQLTDRIAWGAFAKSLIFMPMAISFVGASVIFKLIYDARPAGTAQIGVLNAVWMSFDGGVGTTLMLKVLPTIILIAFVLIVTYTAYVFSKPLMHERIEEHAFVKAIRVASLLIGGWVLAKTIMLIIAILGANHAYGVPQQWLTLPFWNNFFLMVVLIWIQTGFAMVILSAAIRSIPEETIEAAVLDGANPFQVFFKIKVPQIMGTIVVVWTTITLVVLKVFDIVFAMTNGQWETQVLANYMYDKMFVAYDWGVASAAAMVIMVLVTPILVWNVYTVRKEMR